MTSIIDRDFQKFRMREIAVEELGLGTAAAIAVA
jgi:hypothetical protein